MAEVTEREKAEASFAFIVDSLSTATGEFLRALTLMREMAKRADNGDEKAREILQVIYRFERFLRYK